MEQRRRFWIRTYGCQMNVHDSEKISSLLHHADYVQAASEDSADLLVINTCSIRDKAEQHLYSDLGLLREWKRKRPGRALGVGGCVAQHVGDGILERFAHVDFVFGTHNLRLVPAMLAAAEQGRRSVRTDESTSLERFDLPARHPSLGPPSGGSVFLTVMEGCDMFCSFCIVPRTRGREISRPARAVLAEARQRVDEGACEIVLLGQTVNAYGRHDVRRGRAAQAGTMPFAELLAELDAIRGLERIRYTSPHPIFFDRELCRAHGELESLCPHVHLPVQSGSSVVLEAMRRRYTRERYLEIVQELRAARPDIAITSDLIVGFPGERPSDFEQTLSLVREAGLCDSYCFKYSPRPGTAAAELDRALQVPAELAQQRLEALQSLQREQTLAHHRSRVGSTTVILVRGPSRKSGVSGRPPQVQGRDPYHRVVNLDLAASPAPAAGRLVEVELVEATPHSLIAELPGAAAARRAGHAAGERSASGAELLQIQ